MPNNKNATPPKLFDPPSPSRRGRWGPELHCMRAHEKRAPKAPGNCFGKVGAVGIVLCKPPPPQLLEVACRHKGVPWGGGDVRRAVEGGVKDQA